MPTARLAQFSADIRRAKDLVGLGQSIGAMTQGVVDASDLFRAGLVQSVAALDHYVHGVVLDRGVEILLGTKPPGAPTKVGIPFHAVGAILTAVSPSDAELAARTHLAQRISLETYQRPDDIGSALAAVGVARVWSTAFPNAGHAKTALSLVVQRRNRIVHQCDSDPLTPGSVTALSAQDALDSITVVEGTVTALDMHC